MGSSLGGVRDVLIGLDCETDFVTQCTLSMSRGGRGVYHRFFLQNLARVIKLDQVAPPEESRQSSGPRVSPSIRYVSWVWSDLKVKGRPLF